MYAILISNDTPEIWGPYETTEEAEEVVVAYVADPDTATIVPATSGMMYDGRPQ